MAKSLLQTCVLCTCSIWHRSDEQSMFSQGWYIPRVTQFSRITIILTRSNHVETQLVKDNIGSHSKTKGFQTYSQLKTFEEIMKTNAFMNHSAALVSHSFNTTEECQKVTRSLSHN